MEFCKLHPKIGDLTFFKWLPLHEVLRYFEKERVAALPTPLGHLLALLVYLYH